jgi:hypothetical protein
MISKIKGDLLMGEQVNLATIQLNGSKQSFILNEKNFKTGSKGFHAFGKMQIGEKNYQVNIQCVEIGSKPKEEEKKK